MYYLLWVVLMVKQSCHVAKIFIQYVFTSLDPRIRPIYKMWVLS